MSDSRWSHESDLPVLLPSGDHVRLGELTGDGLLGVALEKQTAQVREILESIRAGYLLGRVSGD